MTWTTIKHGHHQWVFKIWKLIIFHKVMNSIFWLSLWYWQARGLLTRLEPLWYCWEVIMQFLIIGKLWFAITRGDKLSNKFRLMISGHMQNILERCIRFVLGIILLVELCIFLVMLSEIKLSWEFVVIGNMHVSFYLFRMWLLRCDILFCHCLVCVSEWEKSIVRSFLCVKTVALFD